MNDTWESDIGGLLAELADVQTALLGTLSEKRLLLAAGDHAALTAMGGREQELADRLQACHERRQQLLARANADGLPADSIQSLSERAAGGEPRPRAGQHSRSGRAHATSSAPEPGQLGASTTIAATSLAVDRDYCYRRAAEADIW